VIWILPVDLSEKVLFRCGGLWPAGLSPRWIRSNSIAPTDYDLEIGQPEFGYVLLRELEDKAGRLPYPVKPDPRFAARPLSAYTAVAYTRGLIVD
jgi:hypothetical protein